MGFRTSCGCSSITPKALTIPPNSTRSIELTLDLRSDDERLSRPFSVDLLPISDSVGFQPPGWTVHGEVRSVVAVGTKPFVVEQEIVRGTEMVPSTCFTMMPLVPVQPVGCDFDASLGIIEFGNAEDGAIRLGVRPNASLPAGTYEWNVVVRVQDEDGFHLPVHAFIVFHIVEDVVCTPSTVLLGVVPVGESAEAVLRLASRTGTRFRIVSASSEANDLKVDVGGYAEEPTLDARIRVTQQVYRGGSQCSRIRLLVRAENEQAGSACPADHPLGRSRPAATVRIGTRQRDLGPGGAELSALLPGFPGVTWPKPSGKTVSGERFSPESSTPRRATARRPPSS